MGFRVLDVGSSVLLLGFGLWVLGFGFGAWAYGCRVDGLRFLM